MDERRPACVSCEISFIAPDSVLALLCGHLYHEICVDRMEFGDIKICLTCLTPSNTSQSLRVYFPFLKDVSSPESAVSNLRKLKHYLKETEYDYAREQLVESDLSSVIGRTTKSVKTKDEKVAELKALKKEKYQLHRKVKKLQAAYTVQMAMFGTRKDVDKILNNKLPAYTLATVAAVLKRKTKRTEAEKLDSRLKVRKGQKENQILLAKSRALRDKIQITVARRIKNNTDRR